MGLAGAPAAAPIDLAPVTGRALPRRLLALFADTFVISLLDAILNGTFGVTRVTSGIATTMGSGGYSSFTTQTTVDWPWLALLWVTYYAVLEGLFGATVGKRLAGVRVTDVEGRRIGPQAAIVRNLARLLDVLPFTYVLGGILTLATRQHQRLGDRLAGTIVVPVDAVSSPPLEPGVRRRRLIGVAAATALLLALCAVFAYYGRPHSSSRAPGTRAREFSARASAATPWDRRAGARVPSPIRLLMRWRGRARPAGALSP